MSGHIPTSSPSRRRTLRAPTQLILSSTEWAAECGTGKMEGIVGEDWTPQTLPSWLHSIWVGVVDPWIVISKGPRICWLAAMPILACIILVKSQKGAPEIAISLNLSWYLM
eukprot:1154691-Pelagomonas_calceolata.AAC.2